jgi:RHS repeat-associated protein
MAFTPHAGTNKIKTITDSAPCPNNKVIHRELDNTELHAVGQTIQADNTVMETAAITYQAGKSITLQAGFHAKAGTDFLAKIETCPQGGFETDGFVQRSHADIEYDVDGNRTKDPNKGIEIAFNYLNQPYKVTWQNGNTIEWLRDGGGTKLQRLTKRNGVAIGKLDYVDGSIEYEGDTLTTIYLEDAKATFDKGILEKYAWFLKNHLMSTQVVFEDDGSGKAAFISTHQQYPFGLEMEGDFGRNKSVKRLYNFKEQIGDFGLNWSDFGARYYLGNGGEPVFLGVDPISDKFPELSTYNYASNSPISNVDLHGLQSAGFMFALGNSRERIRQEQGKAAAKEFDRGVQTGAGATLGIASIFFPDPSDAIVLGALGRLGKTLGLFKTSNKIAQKLSKADDKVREVGEAIEEAMPGTIKDVEKVVKNSEGKIKTDFDLETDDFVIEVTKGGGKGKANQIKNKIQPETKKEVIIFGDKLKPSVKKELKKQNIRFFENKDDMINAIKNNRNK